jgi:hypothetical protein
VLLTRAKLLTRLDAGGRLVWAHDPLHRTISPTMFRLEEFQVVPEAHRVSDAVRERRPVGMHPLDGGAASRLKDWRAWSFRRRGT